MVNKTEVEIQKMEFLATTSTLSDFYFSFWWFSYA